MKFDRPLVRSALFRVDAMSDEERTVELSFSSEEPYSRYFGTEILGHGAGEVRLGRLQNAAPLLFNHDPDEHIGRVMSAQIVNGRGVAKVKFSNSSDGNDKLQDVRDGILREVSVGYRIHAMQLVKEEAGVSTYRVTDWEPLEISLVSIPADTTVGIGRAGTFEPFTVRIQNLNTMPDATPTTTVDVVEIERKANAAALQRLQGIEQATATLARRGFPVDSEIRQKALAEGWTGDRLMASVLESAAPVSRAADTDVLDTMRAAEKREFSLCRAIAGHLSRGGVTGFEAEVIQEVMRKTGLRPSESGALLIPYGALSVRSLTAGAFGSGGSLVPVGSGPMIEKLDPQPVCQLAGATVLRGLTGPTAFPRQTGGATAHWVGEGVEVPESTPATDDVILTPHGISAYVEASRQLILGAAIDTEAWIRNEILKRINLGIDRGALIGSGSSGVPEGIFLKNTSTSGINTVSFGGAATWKKILEFQGAVESDDALGGSLAWITTASTKAAWQGTSKDTGSGTFLAMGNEANGAPIFVTSQLGSGTYANRVLFGDFSQMLIAMYGAVELLVDSSAAVQRRGMLGITGLAHADVAFRHLESFAVSTDAGNQ